MVKQLGSVTHQMAVPVPSISCCVLNHHNLFYQIQNALAFNQDTGCHLALCLQLLPFHWHDYNTAWKTELLNYDCGTLLNQVDKKKSFSRAMKIT